MKRVFLILTALSFLVLAGCSGSGSRTKTDQKYMVSAIGFDAEGDTLRMTAEVIIVNSEKSEEEQKLSTLTGRGRTVRDALEEIGRGIAKPLILSHCGAVLLGESLSEKQVGEICEYCFDEEEITLSAYVMATAESQKLLSCEPVSSLAVGYDLMGLIEQQSIRTGVNFKNRYYEVEAGRLRTQSLFTVPVIRTADDKFSFGGLAVYEEDRLAAQINETETPLYALLTDSFTKGTLLLDGRPLSIQKANTRYTFSGRETGRPQVQFQIGLTVRDADRLPVLEQRAAALAARLNGQGGADVLGLQTLWEREDGKGYQENADLFEEEYQNAELTVRCREEQS